MALYIDGVLDEIEIDMGVTPLINPENDYVMNTTTIGGIRRATASHWRSAGIDPAIGHIRPEADIPDGRHC